MTRKQIPISKAIFRRYILATIGVLVVGMTLSILFLVERSRRETRDILALEMKDVLEESLEIFQTYMSEKTLDCVRIAETANQNMDMGRYRELRSLKEAAEISEINIVNRRGIITASTDPELLGFSMREGKQSSAFMTLLEGTDFYRQEFMKPSRGGESRVMSYAGAAFPDGSGFLQIGVDLELLNELVADKLSIRVRHEHLGVNGFMIICGNDGRILACLDPEMVGKPIPSGISLEGDGEIHTAVVNGISYYTLAYRTIGEIAVAFYPRSEALESVRESILIVTVIAFTMLVTLNLVIFPMLRKYLFRGIQDLTGTLSAIAGGDLEKKADVQGSLEFSLLSRDINHTVDSLKELIAREASRIDKELAYAREIQRSALPTEVRPFSESSEFDLFARMVTAREVGGDFYDYHLLDGRTLSFLVADVSGKGIPAALLMMRCKTLMRDFGENGDPPADVFGKANQRLCAGNESCMFVTSWMGKLDTKTGQVRFVNAGHNPPVLIRQGEARYLQQKINLILGMRPATSYTEQTLQLLPGDLIFVYTDGITEAVRADDSMYGEERLLAVLSGIRPDASEVCRHVCDRVLEDVRAFTASAPQSDDITMMCLFYRGKAET